MRITTVLSLCVKVQRKVRTLKGSVAANSRRFVLNEIGLVQQKASTGNAVVKSGKLYAVKCHVYWCVRKDKGLPDLCQGVGSLRFTVM